MISGEKENNSDFNNLSNKSDEELIELAKLGEDKYLEILLERYKPLVLSLANRYFIRGQDRDDVIQEAMIALFKSIQAFDVEKQTSFAAFVKTTTQNHLIDSIRKSEAKNNRVLNDAVSIENMKFFIEDEQTEDFGIHEEELQDLLNSESFKSIFSDLEWQVLNLRLFKLSYNDIAKELDVKEKVVDNALQRIKHKLKNIFED